MRVRRLRIEQLRNHRTTELECALRSNFLVGTNGQGKTTVLEAIGICALTKSFVPLPRGADAQLVQRGAGKYFIEGLFVTDSGRDIRVAVEYDEKTGKKIVVEGQALQSYARHIGTIPVVVVSPDDRGITMGAPGERRTMLDILIAQARRSYLEALISYRKVLRQRNAMLTELRKNKRYSPENRNELATWGDALALSAAQIFSYRRKFLETFKEYLQKAYESLSSELEAIDIEYNPNVPAEEGATIEEWQNKTAEAIREREQEEIARGTTLVGPHRDDVILKLNGVEARLGASQGQHKTLLGALKLAEWHYLHDVLNERPIFLFDDLFSELDRERAARFVDVMKSCGQVIVTAVDAPEHFTNEKFADGQDDAMWIVNNGEIESYINAGITTF
jgi:DNA replication and repair protein RecF